MAREIERKLSAAAMNIEFIFDESSGNNEEPTTTKEFQNSKIHSILSKSISLLYPNSICYVIKHTRKSIVVEIIDTRNIDYAVAHKNIRLEKINAAMTKHKEKHFISFGLTKFTSKMEIPIKVYLQKHKMTEQTPAAGIYTSVFQPAQKETATPTPSSIKIKRGDMKIKATGMAANFIAFGECVRNILHLEMWSLWTSLRDAFGYARSIIPGIGSGSLILQVHTEDDLGLLSLVNGKTLQEANNLLAKVTDVHESVRFSTFELVSFEYVMLDDKEWGEILQKAEALTNKLCNTEEKKFKTEDDTATHIGAKEKTQATGMSLKRSGGPTLEKLNAKSSKVFVSSIPSTARTITPSVETVFPNTDLKHLANGMELVDLVVIMDDKYEIGGDLRDAEFLMNYFSVLLKTNRYDKAVRIAVHLVNLLKQNLSEIAPKDMRSLAESNVEPKKINEALLFHFLSGQLPRSELADTQESMDSIRVIANTMIFTTAHIKSFIKLFLVPLVRLNLDKISKKARGTSTVQCLAKLRAQVTLAEIESLSKDFSEKITLENAIGTFKEQFGEKASHYVLYGKCFHLLALMYRAKGKSYSEESKDYMQKALTFYKQAKDFNEMEKVSLFNEMLAPKEIRSFPTSSTSNTIFF